MTKVVYNNCFGGFSISRECCEWLAERGVTDCIDQISIASAQDGDEDLNYFWWDGDRHDSLLVMAVEELGSNIASGGAAQLAVTEIKGNKYIIKEYDGSESIIEPHNINWIEV